MVVDQKALVATGLLLAFGYCALPHPSLPYVFCLFLNPSKPWTWLGGVDLTAVRIQLYLQTGCAKSGAHWTTQAPSLHQVMQKQNHNWEMFSNERQWRLGQKNPSSNPWHSGHYVTCSAGDSPQTSTKNKTKSQHAVHVHKVPAIFEFFKRCIHTSKPLCSTIASKSKVVNYILLMMLI